MLTENEKEFLTALHDYEIQAHDAAIYVKENYGVDAEFKDGQFILNVENQNDAMMLIAAKQYLYETLDNNFLQTNID